MIPDGFVGKFFPGGVAVVFSKKGIEEWYSFGRVSRSGEKPDLDTIYDLASLTKVIVTAPLIMKFVEMGKISPMTRLADVIEELSEDEKGNLRILDLLTHTSGLPAYVDLTGSNNPLRDVLKLKLVYETGSKVVYSCMGYIILGLVLERISGKRLDELAHDMIFKPLGMESSTFNPTEELLSRIAPTTFHGVVHDPNARALGGVSGNAGLFSSARDVVKFMISYINNEFLSKASVEYSMRDHTENLNEHRGIGWDIKHEGSTTFPELASNGTIGHTGYTGTSVWYDASRDCGLLLLTNRVHMGDTETSKRMINEFRRRVGNSVLSKCTAG